MTKFEGENATLVWAIFIFATIITQVTFFNMLIAIMGAAYEETLANTHVALKEQVALLSDWAWTLKLYQKIANTSGNINFMFAISPADEEEMTMEEKLEELKEEVQENRNTTKEEQEKLTDKLSVKIIEMQM